MKKFSLGIFSIFIVLASLALPGCANMTLGVEETSEPMPEEMMDPITAIGLKLRNTAPSAEAQEAANEEEEVRVLTARQQGRIAVGMPMRDVRNVYGEPVDVQIAGDSDSGHEKWIYYDGLSARWGLGSSREVYFENGRVVGWETHSK